jgi:AraC family transcriptional regulator, regulatory protein of adaptative response / DNA-3-methyladenine glycosylase II
MVSGQVNAVVTTGIYCRDGCPASPDPANVRTYPIDVAAEQDGFRPCLRCRPDRRAPSTSWSGVPALVEDALQEICHGALDTGIESELPAHIGASPRHLRRLFSDHLGVTPTQVAISRRAHFARRLIDEIDLPVAQIAFAAGFGSVRTLNATIKQIFRFTPSEFRAKRRHTDLVEADGGIALTLPFDTDIDWDAVLADLSATAIAGVEKVSGRSYRRIVVIAGNPGAVQLIDLDPRTLRIEAHLPRFDCLIDIASYARRLAAPSHEQPRARGWTATKSRVRHLLVAELGERTTRTILSNLAVRHGSDLYPLRPLGLTHTNPDYQTLSDEDWTSAGTPRRLVPHLPHPAARPTANPRVAGST